MFRYYFVEPILEGVSLLLRAILQLPIHIKIYIVLLVVFSNLAEMWVRELSSNNTRTLRNCRKKSCRKENKFTLLSKLNSIKRSDHTDWHTDRILRNFDYINIFIYNIIVRVH